MSARRHTSNGTGQSVEPPRAKRRGPAARPVVWVPVPKVYGAKSKYGLTAYERRRDQRKASRDQQPS